jgi:hypothetical protein
MRRSRVPTCVEAALCEPKPYLCNWRVRACRNTGSQPVRLAGFQPVDDSRFGEADWEESAGWKPAGRTGWKPVLRRCTAAANCMLPAKRTGAASISVWARSPRQTLKKLEAAPVRLGSQRAASTHYYNGVAPPFTARRPQSCSHPTARFSTSPPIASPRSPSVPETPSRRPSHPRRGRGRRLPSRRRRRCRR